MISISSYVIATPSQMIKLKAALDLANAANSSGAFKDKVMTAKFTETTDDNATIYANTQKDVSIQVSFYTPSCWQRIKAKISGWSEVAAESGTGSVTFNSVIFAQNSIGALTNTIRHEALHDPIAGGYRHDFNPTPQRPNSVNYLCGSFIQQVVESKSY